MKTPSQIEEETRAWRAAALVNFPYELLKVPGAAALPTWQRLKSRGRGVPVVIGPDDSLDSVLRYLHVDRAPMSGEQALEQAKVNLKAAAALRHPQDLRTAIEEQVGAPVDPPDIGEWPAEDLASEVDDDFVGIALDDEQVPLPLVHIALIPAEDASGIPAYLNYGGWNSCPFPAYQVAALRSWRDRYGAELIGIGAEMNLRAARLPSSRDEALKLAREHFDFCPDIFEDGGLTLSDMAAYLMADRWWNFAWWG